MFFLMDKRMYDAARMYHRTHGTLLIVASKDKATHQRLNDYLNELRKKNEEGTLSPDIKAKYDKLGMAWKDVEQKEWSYCYELAKQYSQIFGTLEMPTAFEMNGVKLGAWLDEQKQAHKLGELSLNREDKLEKLGMQWESKNFSQVSFAESSIAYYVAKVFPDTITSYRPDSLRGKELDIYIPSLNLGIEYDGGIFHKNLGKDLSKNRLCEESGIKLIRVREKSAPKMHSTENCTVIERVDGSNGLHQAIKRLFTTLGVENIPDIGTNRDKNNILSNMFEDRTYFNQYLMAAKHYYQENGHLFVPKYYKDPTGVRLGQWIQQVRESKDNLSERQINALDELDMCWGSVVKEKWLCDFDKATSYKEIPETETTVDGKSLRVWFNDQKESYEQGKMFDDYKYSAFEKLQAKQNERETQKRRRDDYER